MRVCFHLLSNCSSNNNQKLLCTRQISLKKLTFLISHLRFSRYAKDFPLFYFQILKTLLVSRAATTEIGAPHGVGLDRLWAWQANERTIPSKPQHEKRGRVKVENPRRQVRKKDRIDNRERRKCVLVKRSAVLGL